MAVTVRVPGALKDSTGGQGRVSARGATLGEVIDDVDRAHPGFRARILDDSGGIRTYVNVYIGDEDARHRGGATAPVPDGAEVMVIPAMAGGRP